MPPVTELARADTSSVEAARCWLLNYYNGPDIPWNYVGGTKIIKASYKGFHSINSLLAGCDLIKSKTAKIANADVVRLAAPIAFGRSTQVFDLSRRQFPFGRDLRSGYRVPFFFVENGEIKLYFLQPRKGAALTYDQLCMVATVHKRFLIDDEFYGEACDVEYVDVSADEETGERTVAKYGLSDFELWSEKRLREHLTVIATAYEQIVASGQVMSKSRVGRKPDPDMPLFD